MLGTRAGGGAVRANGMRRFQPGGCQPEQAVPAYWFYIPHTP